MAGAAAVAVVAEDDTQAEDAARRHNELKDKLEKLIGELQTEANKRVGNRKSIEDRWIMDIRQFYGQYDATLLADLIAQDKSTLFINETMPKTVACSARLFDMLFPTDDRNFGIKPTPVPELASQAAEGFDNAREAVPDANAALQGGDHAGAAQIAVQGNADAAAAQQAEDTLEAARKAADAMQEEIDDQLKECHYAAEAREVIEDMCRCGAGVIEGPVASDRVKQVWQTRPVLDKTGKPMTDGDGNPLIEDYLEAVTSPKPAARRVDFWGFFPESDATTPEDSADFYVRRLLNKRRLRQLAREPGFNKDAIRELITSGPKSGSLPTYLADLRGIASATYNNSESRFVVWEYRGPIEGQTLKDICACLSYGADETTAKTYNTFASEADDTDPLDEINVVLWFCDGKCLKFGIHHLDRGDPIYSVVPLEKDGASIWGLGIPALMRDPQSALSAAWRMMMDNGGLSSGPQILINRAKLSPTDGSEDLYARKIWDIKAGTPAGEKLMEMLEVESNQGAYAAIIEMADGFIDTMSGQPKIAQGEQPTGITKTLGGMSMLMNSANLLIRRIVRNFDDRLTTPLTRRFYDWNMQFSKKRNIKGDFNVDARGSSVLLVKELQSQNMMAFALNFGGHPVFGRFIKDLETLQEVAKTNMIPAGKVIKTAAEVKAEEEAQAAKGPPPDPEQIKAEAQMKLLDKEYGYKLQISEREENIAMMQYAEKRNIELDKVRTQLQNSREERAHKERIFAGEAAMEARTSAADAARGLRPKGSGGYISA